MSYANDAEILRVEDNPKDAEALLCECEARLDEAQAVAHLGSWTLDLVSDVLHWSEETYRILDIDPAKFGASYKAFLNAVHPDDRARINTAYTDAVASRERYSIEHRLLMPDGHVKWVHARVMTVYDENGRPLRSTGTVQDITERKQAEDRLSLASLIIEKSPTVLVRTRVSAGWPLIYISENVRQWGYSAEKLIAGQQPVSTLIHPDDVKRIADEADQRIAAGAEAYSQEYRIVTRAGEPRWVEEHTTVERDASGKPRFLQGIVSDINSRRLNELALQERARRIEAQSEALSEISASPAVAAGDIERVAREVTEQSVRATGVERANVWLFNEAETELRCIDLYEATPARHSSGMLLTEGQFRKEFQALKNAPYVNADDSLTDPRTSGYVEPYLKPLRIMSMLDAVIEVSDRHLGLLCLEHVDRAHHWEQDEIEFVCRLADKIGLTISNRATRQAQDQLRISLEQAICAMANAVEVRDPYTAGHQRRVAGLAAAIARELGLNEEQIHGLKLAATVHDLGKLQVPMEILNKPGKLTQLEYQLIQTHVQAGFDIVKDVSFPWPIAEMILQHHERLDGSGYPRGLKADQMLLESKILAVADMVEAMVSHRPYRAAVGLEVALAEIIKGRGGVFDAGAVDVCVKLLRETGSEAFKVLEP